MKDVLRLIYSGYHEIGGLLGIGIALATTFWVNSWSRVPPATIIAACLYGIVTAYVAAVTRHIFRLPDFTSARVWMGFVVLYLGYAAMIAVLFFIKGLIFGPPSK